LKVTLQRNVAIEMFGGGLYFGVTYMRRWKSLTFFVGDRLLTIHFRRGNS
jgi:hypothetical protein